MIKKIIRIIIFVIIGLILLIALLLHFFFKGMCNDDLVGKYLSPNGRNEIFYHVVDCGATTGFANDVELNGTRILQGEPDNGTTDRPFEIVWINDKKIYIGVATTTTSLQIYKKPVENYQEIYIEYDPKIIKSYEAYSKR